MSCNQDLNDEVTLMTYCTFCKSMFSVMIRQ